VRLRLGRPDLAHHAGRFAVPEAGPGSPVSVTFLGVSTLLFRAADGAFLTDGYFSRPGLLAVAGARLAPDRSRIRACLDRAQVGRLVGVLPVHTHVDHALDSAVVAQLTGAPLVGGVSAMNVGRGAGLPEDRLLEVADGTTTRLGGFEVTAVASEHCPPDRYPGSITAPVRFPARAGAFRCGEAWSVLVTHVASGRRALVQGSAGFRPGALAGREADVVYLGVGQLGLQSESYLRRYWQETVRAVRARRVVAVHWDDFFRPLDVPLRAIPYAGDDLDRSLRVLGQLAEQDGTPLQMPTVWRPEDPWAR
jgi:L-ascorbate metabolism protein UlaG (beta-lactamase superfamily)